MANTNLYKPSLFTLALMTTLSCNEKECENERVEKVQQKQEAYEQTHSVERDNINTRLKLFDDPNHILWIYCLSDTGNVVLSSPLVGKVTSSGKRLEPREASGRVGGDGHNYGYVGKEKYHTNEILGVDGTYGSSDSYVYWFTPEGQYLQWNGNYLLSSVPFKLEKHLFNTSNIDLEDLKKGQQAEKALKEGKKVSNTLELLIEDKK